MWARSAGGIWTNQGGWRSEGWGRPAATGGAWTPLSLGSALKAWYKADTGVYSDAGVTPATNGGRVQQWNDQSGNGYHLKQSTGAIQPIYSTAVLNSLPAIFFDNAGSNSGGMQTASQPITLGGTTFSAFSLRKITSVAVSSARVLGISTPGSSDTGSDVCIPEYCPGTSITTPTTYNSGNKSNGSVVSGSWNQVGSIFDGVNDTMYIANSAQTAVGATPTFAASVDLDVFGDASNSNGSTPNGYCAEIIITNTALSSTDRNNLASYLTAKWGV